MSHLVRRLRQSPSFTCAALLTLALGIGANTAIFSVVNGVLLKPLPHPDPDRLAGVWLTAPGVNLPDLNASPATYFTFREESRTFTDSAAWRSETHSITGIGEPEEVDSLVVTDGFFPILGVRPLLGRLFTKQDDTPGSPDTVILSYRYWQQRFGGSPDVLSRTLRVNSKPYQIAGVLPREFRFQSEDPAIVLTLRFDRSKTSLGNFSYRSIARLKDGVTVDQANADIARMLPLAVEKFPPPPGISARMFTEARIGPNLRLLKRDVIGDVDKVLWALMGAVGLVLLIACANVANLLLVRAEGRQQEIAIRSALGASWTGIARSLLGESLTLAVLGGVLGVAVAYGALRLLLALGPGRLPRLAEISIDLPTLAFSVAISLFAGLVFGLVPVLKYATPNLASALHSAGRGSSEGRERHRARNTLVVVQVALALVLLIGSGLMIRTFWALKSVHPGFTSPERILTARVYIPPADVPKPEDAVRLHHDMLQRVAALAGLQHAALSSSVTMDGNNSNDPIFAEDKVYAESKLPPIRRYKYISPGFFPAMGNRLVAGRDLTWTDTFEIRPYVILSECLARELWGDPAKAIGKRVRPSLKSRWHEVIGVAADDRADGVHRKATATVYWPLLTRDQWSPGVSGRRSLLYVVRSPRVGSPGFLGEVQQAIWSLGPSFPIASPRTVAEIQQRSMARTSFTLVMLALAGFMALLLGVIGIYGVISYSVTRRTREIGIRIALGAASGRVHALFLREGLTLTLVGLALGLAVSAGLTRLISSLLFGITPLDPVTYVAVPLALAAAAALAAYVPARRATRIHPVDALRAE